MLTKITTQKNLKFENEFLDKFIWKDLGTSKNYHEVWALQRELRKNLLNETKSSNRKKVWVLTCSHSPTLTFGYRSQLENELQDPKNSILNQGISVVQCERGGLATYHGPGQWMFYPIFHLPSWDLRVRDYVKILMEVTCQTLRDFGVKDPKKGPPNGPGIWVGDAKIAAIGIHISKGVCIHGLCLNLWGELDGFSLIHPCGQKNMAITHLSEVLGRRVSPDSLVHIWLAHFWNQLTRT